ncbi:MAG: response regulator transcription factor [Oscillospiraceae bacterium]|nr:response regulator transcription factor [Oscillospiraceae bacterium]
MRVLIVEDEIKLADALIQILNKNKISADACYDGADGLDNALTGIYDVIVLDIMLPKMNGIDVLRNIRKEGLTTPILLFTAKDDVADKVRGLDSGADDYLTKPFATEELLARIRALGRRSTAGLVSDDRLEYGDIVLDLSAYELSSGKNSVKLGLKEFSIMELLMKNTGRVLTKENLIIKVWGYESDAEYNNVEVYISFLRKKLSFLKSKTIIKTIRGVGYIME